MDGAEDSLDLQPSDEPDTSSKFKPSLECAAEQEGVPISMRFSSDWEAVTTPGTTFMGVALMVHLAHARAIVTRGTHSRSRSSSKRINHRADRKMECERLREYTKSCFGSISVST